MGMPTNQITKAWRSGLSLLLCLACAMVFTPSQSEAQALPVSPGPSFLDAQEEASSTHLRRLAEYENTTDAVGYLNNDGTKTVYIYGDDVRYQDNSGRMVEKNINLIETSTQERASSGYRYRTAANEITAYFPEHLTQDAIAMDYNDHRITLQPDWESASQPELEDGTKAVDRAAAGKITAESLLSGTLLRQTVTSTTAGEMEYTADFGDLTPTIIEECTVSLADAAGEEQLRLGGFMLTDSEGRVSDDLTLSMEENVDGSYTVQIGLDDDFIQAAAADSTVSLNSSVTVPASSGIDAATVYFGSPSTTHGTSIVNHIGYNWDDTTKKFARTFVKFDLSSLSNVRYDNITSACYRFTEGSGNNATAVMEAYFVKSSWSESTITWNNKPDYYGDEVISKININKTVNGMNYDLYITSAVQGWLQGLANYGIMFKEKDDGQWQILYSDDSSVNKPCLVVTYLDESEPTQTPGVTNTTYYLINKDSAKYLTAAGTTIGSNITESTTSVTARKVWQITSLGSCYYTLKCGNYYLTAGGNSPSASLSLQAYSSTNDQQKWKIIRNWDGSYHLLSKAAEAGKLCLSGGATDGVSAKMAIHSVNFTRADDWTLIPTVKGTASFFYDSTTFEQDHMQIMRQTLANIMSFTNGMGYSSTRRDDVALYTGRNQMLIDSIWVATSHGNKSYQTTSSVDYISTEFFTSQITVGYISSYLLKNLQLAIYHGCSTGINSTGDTANLVGLTYQRGAHNVIGNQQTIYSPDCSYWRQSLFTGLSVGYTLREAEQYADENLYEQSTVEFYSNLNARHSLGDDSFRFNLSAYPTSSTSSTTLASCDSVENVHMGAFIDQDSVILGENDSLEKIAGSDTSASNDTYNVYRDSSNNLYTVLSGSNVLASYIPDTQDFESGDTIVDSQTALQQASEFLASAGYNVSGFTMTHSNEFSKRFQITYQYRIGEINTTEKLCLYFEAETDGTVHLVRFAAYDYGAFSGEGSPSITTNDYAILLPSLEQAAIVKAAGNSYTISEPVWTRNANGQVQLRATIYFTDLQGNPFSEQVYSIIT